MDSIMTEAVQKAAARTDFTLTPEAALELAAHLVEGARKALKPGYATTVSMAAPFVNTKISDLSPKAVKGQATHFPGVVNFYIQRREQ